MPDPSTPSQVTEPRRTFHEALLAFLSGSIATFFLASVLVLAIVAMLAGVVALLVWVIHGWSGS